MPCTLRARVIPKVSRWCHVLFLFQLLAGWTGSLEGHGDYHDVAAEVQRALAQDPGNADHHFRLAVAAEEHGDWAQALISLEMTERLAPGRPLVRLVQGRALAKACQWQAARTLLDEFINLQPDHVIAKVERARVLVRLGQTSSALADYKQALFVEAKPAPEWFIEAADLLLASEETRDALAWLKHGLTTTRNHPELLEKTALLCIELADWDGALACLEGLQKQDVQPARWLAAKARVLNLAGRGSAAQAAWEDLLHHLQTMPSLERGRAEYQALLAEAKCSLTPSASPAAKRLLQPVIAAPLTRKFQTLTVPAPARSAP